MDFLTLCVVSLEKLSKVFCSLSQTEFRVNVSHEFPS